MVVIVAIIFVGLVAYFFWNKNRKPGNSPKESYKELLQTHVAFYQKQDDNGEIKFEKIVDTFLNDTRIEGVETEIAGLDKALIAKRYHPHFRLSRVEI